MTAIKRLRVVAAATLLLIVIVFLFAHQTGFTEGYQLRSPFGYVGHNKNSSSVPNKSEETLDDDDYGLLASSSSQPEPDSINKFPQDAESSQEIPLPESLPQSSNLPKLDDEPKLPTADNQALPTGADDEPSVFQPEFLFQQDLKLDLPIDRLRELSTYKPHNYDLKGPQTYAYSTFMATRNPSLKDPYYMAIHSLIYRVLWAQRSRSQKYPFIVFVADFVTAEQRELLAGAGAIVRELAPLEWNPNVPGIQHRWKDLFAKLNMWNETEFSRILFLDADAFPVDNIDSMFDISPQQDCINSKLQPDDYLLDGSQVCEPYVFAGVPQDPFNETDVNINVGSMVFTPSQRMHQRLLQNYVKTDRYNCLMAEQAFLNWQFNINSAFPATQLEREWGGFFPQENEEGKLKVVHEKLWSDDRRWMKQEWLTQWQEMMTFYTSNAFMTQRKLDGTIFG